MTTCVLLAMGSLLIVSGIGLVVYQVIKPAAATPVQTESAMPVAVGEQIKVEAHSPYPGIIMIGFGTALLLAAQLTATIRG